MKQQLYHIFISHRICFKVSIKKAGTVSYLTINNIFHVMILHD